MVSNIKEDALLSGYRCFNLIYKALSSEDNILREVELGLMLVMGLSAKTEIPCPVFPSLPITFSKG